MSELAIDDADDLDRRPAYGCSMSIEEWEQMDEDAPGELVDGRLEEEEVADNPHEVLVSALLFVLVTWARPRGSAVLPSEAKYAVGKRRGRKPDLSVYFAPVHKLPRRGANRRPPDIMVEVLSPRPRDHRRDRIQKLREYAAFGVRWYWLVDPEARTIEVLRLGDDGHYVHALDAEEGTVPVPGCEGLTLDIDALWRELDERVESEDESGARSRRPTPWRTESPGQQSGGR
jgi:Uma2 family endonuclease